jgi:hypothetical protein
MSSSLSGVPPGQGAVLMHEYAMGVMILSLAERTPYPIVARPGSIPITIMQVEKNNYSRFSIILSGYCPQIPFYRGAKEANHQILSFRVSRDVTKQFYPTSVYLSSAVIRHGIKRRHHA